MRIPRIYVPDPITPQAPLTLGGNAANHIGRVLRLKPDAPLILFNGQGGEYPAVIRELGKCSVIVEVQAYQQHERESPLDISLVQGISRGERMDYTIQKSVELGVRRIVPIITERTVVKLDDKRRHKRWQHWQGVIIAACEQCGRNRLPVLEAITDLPSALQAPGAGRRLLLDHRSAASVHSLQASQQLCLLIGPEGGLSDTERTLAAAQGFVGIRLGPRILRTETAALAAITALQTLWGDLH